MIDRSGHSIENETRARAWFGAIDCPRIPLVADSAWLKDHAFLVRVDGALDRRSNTAHPACMFAQSYKSEVQTASCAPDTWTGNALRFATHAEADAYALDLSMRWTAVRAYRVQDSADPVNATYPKERN